MTLRASLLLLAALAACSPGDAPLAPVPGQPGSPLGNVGVTCRADVRAGSVACDGVPASGARGDIIVGGQREYVTLTSSGVAYDAVKGEFTFQVTVENLIPQPMGTEDGVKATPEGVRIFFAAEPVATSLTDAQGSSELAVVPDEHGVFTSSGQPFYQYSGYFLGDDGILSPGETSLARPWKIRVDPNVKTFAFTLYVWAQVPSPGGYVDVAPAAWSMGIGDTTTLAGTVRSAVGTRLPGVAVGWTSSDPAVVSVDKDGRITAVGAGTATVTGRDGNRIGTALVLVGGHTKEQYRAVSAGGAASCAVTVGRSVFCIGSGTFGLMGNGQFTFDITGPQRVLDEPWDTVAVGWNQACALKGGAAWCWGLDQWGALGTGAMLPPCKDSPYGSSSYGCSNHPLPVAGGHTFTRITAAGNALQAFVGPPFAMFACGIATGGAGWCWGGDADGELGDGAQYPLNNPAPVAVAGGLAFTYIASGFDGSCALTAAGAAYCWGDEKSGEMGNDAKLEDVLVQPTPVQGGLAFRQIDMGRAAACGVTTDGDVYCWGNNVLGVLGTDQPVQDCRPAPTSPYPAPCSPVPVKVALPEGVEFVRATVGLTNACALSADGRAWCWGEATGVGAGDPRKIPGAERCISHLSDLCLFRPVQVATSFRFVDLDTAAGSHCAISTTRQWLCWPFRPFGSLSTSFVPAVVADPAS